jgi:hypothetical protein
MLSLFLKQHTIEDPRFFCLFHTKKQKSTLSPIVSKIINSPLQEEDASYFWTSVELGTCHYVAGIRRELVFQYQLFSIVTGYNFSMFTTKKAARIATMPHKHSVTTLQELDAYVDQQTLDFSAILTSLTQYME